MPRKRSERNSETRQGQWERGVHRVRTSLEHKPDTFEDIVEFYAAYLCGVLDVLAEFKGSLYAADVRKTLKETVESVVKDAWALQSQGR